MQRNQANRARIAKRAGNKRPRPETMPAHLTAVQPSERFYVGRKAKRPGSDKGQGMWRCSPYYRTAVTVDSRWSA